MNRSGDLGMSYLVDPVLFSSRRKRIGLAFITQEQKIRFKQKMNTKCYFVEVVIQISSQLTKITRISFVV